MDLMPKKFRKPYFCPFCSASLYKKFENTSLELATEFASRSMTYPSGGVTSHNSPRKFLKRLQFLPENLQQTQKDEQGEIASGEFY